MSFYRVGEGSDKVKTIMLVVGTNHNHIVLPIIKSLLLYGIQTVVISEQSSHRNFQQGLRKSSHVVWFVDRQTMISPIYNRMRLDLFPTNIPILPLLTSRKVEHPFDHAGIALNPSLKKTVQSILDELGYKPPPPRRNYYAAYAVFATFVLSVLLVGFLAFTLTRIGEQTEELMPTLIALQSDYDVLPNSENSILQNRQSGQAQGFNGTSQSQVTSTTDDFVALAENPGVFVEQTIAPTATLEMETVADFSVNRLRGVAPFKVNVTNLSSGNLISYLWDFETDGRIDSIDFEPQVITYYTPGIYTITLVVTDYNGNQFHHQETIEVDSANPSKLTLVPDNTTINQDVILPTATSLEVESVEDVPTTDSMEAEQLSLTPDLTVTSESDNEAANVGINQPIVTLSNVDSGGSLPQFTATPTATETPTSTTTPTATNTPTSTVTTTSTPTLTLTSTSTATITSTATETPTSTVTPTATNTPTSTVTPTATNTPDSSIPTMTPLSSPTSIPEVVESIGFAQTSGGAGGDVYVVTTLADAIPAPPGSLREAVEATGKRTVVFAVSGWIDLVKTLSITQPDLTIDGSTAPGKGVGLRIAIGTNVNPMVYVTTHDVIVRYIRLRPGSRGHQVNINSYDNPGFFQTDAILLTGNNGSKVRNVWLDHIDASGSSDGSIEIWGADHITVSNSYIFQGLRFSTHADVWEWNGSQWEVTHPHSMASLVGNGANSISFINNVFAHNGDRVPLFGDVWNVELVNNIIYNPMNSTIKLSIRDASRDPSGEWKVNVIGNRIINNGYDTRQYDNAIPRYIIWPMSNVLNVYLKNNISYYRPTNDLPETNALYPENKATIVDTPYDFNVNVADTVVLDTDAKVLALLNSSGVTSPAPDSLHEQIKNDIMNALAGNPTGIIIDHVREDGYPNLD